MMTLNNLPDAGISEADSMAFQTKLLSLLAKQTRRYTAGDSSSVRIEIAQSLLISLCYCLKISPDHPDAGWRLLLDHDLDEEYRKGLRRIQRKIAYGKQLWQEICTNLPSVQNIAMLDTLNNIGKFWKRYDYHFFAHEIPCDIDYQLAIAVSESAQGVDYVNRYLEQLWVENRFLLKYKAEAMIPLLNLYCPDYKGLLINLFEPVFTNAVGLALLDKGDDRLILSAEDLQRIQSKVLNMRRSEIEKALKEAAEKIGAEHGFGNKAFKDYFHGYCCELAARVDAMRDCGGLGGVFLSEDEKTL